MQSHKILMGMVVVLAITASAIGAQNAPSEPMSATLTPVLGRLIFFDQNLSINRNQSCAACHTFSVGWTGPDEGINKHGAVYEGSIPKSFGNRKPPSSAYATLSPVFHCEESGQCVGGNFWDGRATGLKLGNPAADQALGPFLNPVEQALPDAACVVERVCNADYGTLFKLIWGAQACAIAWPADLHAVCAQPVGTVTLPAADRAKVDTAFDDIGLSITAFEDAPVVNQFSSKFDLFRAGKVHLTEQEMQGLRLFQDKARCANCHTLTSSDQGKPPVFTDFTYDNIGVPRNPENPFYKEPELNPLGRKWVDLGLGGFLATTPVLQPDGSILVPDYTKFASDNDGKQRVPTLRNVDKRPWPGFVKAYMHNGYFKSLQSVVHFYNTRDVKHRCPERFTTEAQALAQDCWPEPEVKVNVNTQEVGNLGLAPAEEAALVAFMQTLSDGFRPFP
jgi:cytochrome c peroxidase